MRPASIALTLALMGGSAAAGWLLRGATQPASEGVQLAQSSGPAWRFGATDSDRVTAPPPPPAVTEAALARAAQPERARAGGPQTATQLYQRLGGLLGHGHSHDAQQEGELNAVQGELLGELASNPQALHWAIGQYRAALGTPQGAQLGALLGTLNDPAVAELAASLSAGGSKLEKLAGLELQARLRASTPQMRAHALQALQHGADPEVAGAAIYALRQQPLPPEEAQAVLAAMQRSLSHADPEVRRRAAIGLADWSHDPQTLHLVVKALADPSVDVRAGAAYALGRARVIAPQAEAMLVAQLGNPQEDLAVREMAWRTLKTYPLLSAEAYAAVNRFDSQRAVVSENQAPTKSLPPP